ncbi:MAG: branched-chain amino acid ABC transporter permease [Pseudomonadota bacterium]
MDPSGLLGFGVFFLTTVSIYAVLTLGLNIQWGLTGQINIGIAGFFAIGAYVSALVTAAGNPAHVGGFELPAIAGAVLATAAAALAAALIGAITVNLRTDYLAIATIGIAEIIRFILQNESWLTNGVRGIADIPRPISEGSASNLIFLAIALVSVAVVYWLAERARVSPWGRVLRAIRDNEPATEAAGKNVAGFRLQAFVFGSAVMGFAGALYAHFIGFVSPEAFDPLFATFLVWAMLIVGGSGNNLGAVLGAFVVWIIWSGSELLTGLLPAEYATQASAARVLLVGVLIQVVLLARPEGLLPEPKSGGK